MARKQKYGPKIPYTERLNRRDYSMTATMSDFVKETKKRVRACALQSIQETIEIAQKPVGKGGKMRVDTGFLRASGQISFSGMPSGEGRGRKRTEDDPVKGELYTAATVTLADFKMGQTVWFGWVANYAEYREAYDGFLINAVQQWQSTVDSVCARIYNRSTGQTNRNRSGE